MTIKASRRSKWILAAGLLVCFAGPSQAATDADNAPASSKLETARTPAKHVARHWKRHAHRKFSKTAMRSHGGGKAASTEVAADDRVKPSPIPPSVADANAQLTSSDTPVANAMSARADDILQAAPDKPADAKVASPDQLNDVDRTLRETAPPATTLASAEAPAAPVATANNNDTSTWDQTSLIGKIFIGFGALLTMASAARMFMA